MPVEIWMPSDEPKKRPEKSKRYRTTSDTDKPRQNTRTGGYSERGEGTYAREGAQYRKNRSGYSSSRGSGRGRKSYRSGSYSRDDYRNEDYNRNRNSNPDNFSSKNYCSKSSKGSYGYSKRSYNRDGNRTHYDRDNDSDNFSSKTYNNGYRKESYDKSSKSYDKSKKYERTRTKTGLTADVGVTALTGSSELGSMAGKVVDIAKYKSHENTMKRYKQKADEYRAKAEATKYAHQQYHEKQAYREEIRKQREEEKAERERIKEERKQRREDRKARVSKRLDEGKEWVSEHAEKYREKRDAKQAEKDEKEERERQAWEEVKAKLSTLGYNNEYVHYVKSNANYAKKIKMGYEVLNAYEHNEAFRNYPLHNRTSNLKKDIKNAEKYVAEHNQNN